MVPSYRYYLSRKLFSQRSLTQKFPNLQYQKAAERQESEQLNTCPKASLYIAHWLPWATRTTIQTRNKGTWPAALWGRNQKYRTCLIWTKNLGSSWWNPRPACTCRNHVSSFISPTGAYVCIGLKALHSVHCRYIHVVYTVVRHVNSHRSFVSLTKLTFLSRSHEQHCKTHEK